MAKYVRTNFASTGSAAFAVWVTASKPSEAVIHRGYFKEITLEFAFAPAASGPVRAGIGTGE
ncbi:hypothetical protein LBMAG57_20270 [Verrucomicrobiota bacterium]|nr:hypothetical protein LBMAG57_20270 [Verrucomicrobiota bacterium]